jgi:pyrroline-5-carboxylate reductase
MSSLRLGFLGAGKMASALARGFLRAGAVAAPDRIAASCPKQDAHLLGEFSALGCKTSTDNRDIILSSDVLLMAVKPGVVPAIASEVVDVLSRHDVEQPPFLISMAAGVKLSQLEEALQPQVQKVLTFKTYVCERNE